MFAIEIKIDPEKLVEEKAKADDAAAKAASKAASKAAAAEESAPDPSHG